MQYTMIAVQVLCICSLVIMLLLQDAAAADLGKTRDKRSDDPAPLQAVVDNLVQKVNTLQAQLTAEQTARQTQDTSILSKLDSYGKVVAFHAWCTSAPVSTVAHGTVIVPYAATNIGNAYDPQTGFFTAPVSGLYMFHASFMDNDTNDKISAGIFVGGAEVAASTSDSRHGFFDNPAITAIVHVTTGQRVQLRSLNDKVDNFYGWKFTTFSGFLIRAD